LDFGSKCHESLTGLKVVRLEDILQRFARQTVMNIHIKSIWKENFSRPFIRKIAGLLHQYDCAEHAYFMGYSEVQEAAIEAAPEIPRCMGSEPDMDQLKIVERAIRYNCQKVQFFKSFFNQELIDLAHANNIKCNYFFTDDPVRAQELLSMGIDTVLTNNYWVVAQARDEFLKRSSK
jgi:glycerophosphoryl diester phosphodiesterase